VLPQSFPTKLHQFLINIFFSFFCADRQTDTQTDTQTEADKNDTKLA